MDYAECVSAIYDTHVRLKTLETAADAATSEIQKSRIYFMKRMHEQVIERCNDDLKQNWKHGKGDNDKPEDNIKILEPNKPDVAENKPSGASNQTGAGPDNSATSEPNNNQIDVAEDSELNKVSNVTDSNKETNDEQDNNDDDEGERNEDTNDSVKVALKVGRNKIENDVVQASVSKKKDLGMNADYESKLDENEEDYKKRKDLKGKEISVGQELARQLLRLYHLALYKKL